MPIYHVVRYTYNTPFWSWWCPVVHPGEEGLLQLAKTPPAYCTCGAGLRYENGEPVEDKEKALA